MSPDAQILALSAGELAGAVRAGRLAAVEVARAYLERIDLTQPRVRAYLCVARERALAEAAAVDAARARGEPAGPLAGVPYGLKDSLVAAGLPTTAGSRILAGWIPPYDAGVVRRLRAAGAVLLGKLALDEFAMGTTGEHGPFPAARNPWAPDRVAGGSSSGPAAAVAARAAAFAIGSDTGGSIRLPAAYCGVVGVRPTWGRVSRAGLVAFASSLDAVGPVARDAGDAARVLACLSGHDPEDSTSLTAPAPDVAAAVAGGRGLHGVTVGVDRRALAGLAGDIALAFGRALALLVDAGAALVDVALPDEGEALAAYAALAAAEAASNLARYDGVRFGLCVPRDSYEATAAATRAAGFGAEVKRRIVLGTLVQRSPELLARARAARERVAAGHARALARCDVLAGPTARGPAVRARHDPGDSPWGAEDVSEDMSDAVVAPAADRFLVGAALAGLPALSVPCGFAPATATRPALPLGLHLVGAPLSEARLLAVAVAYEARRGVFPGAPA